MDTVNYSSKSGLVVDEVGRVEFVNSDGFVTFLKFFLKFMEQITYKKADVNALTNSSNIC
jgi:hypothetical protein